MIVLDDPQKADEALSETSRKAVQMWFDDTLRSRLNDKANGIIIIVMQRLHQDDLIGHVLEQEQWDILSLPAIAEVDECHLIDGPLGSRFFTRKPGDILHPARESAQSLADSPTRMNKISYNGYRFPPEIIQQAIWLYLRFTLSLRDVEDLLAERGVTVSYETVRRWVNHFGPMIAAGLRKSRLKPHTTWHLDEVYLKIDGRMVYLWRAVDAEGEVLDVLVQSKRNKHAALKLMRKLMKICLRA
jgi:hypothetical protein